MTSRTNLIVAGICLDLAYPKKLHQRPALFTPREALFWDDPNISEQMLAAHLDPRATQPAAVRRSSIARSRGSSRDCNWIGVVATKAE